ncbi:MAG: hypothetical protein DRQ48_01075 [Gammaproteobacteria bacterium]|nr:MAG: hypothetical protein DRQ58_01185 [Gammaproteobacteria bacterium]RKZ72182.1 MAG: hypothetical protein DRQ48_01075 [Gammaproteobacteria bacterium]
MIKYLPLLLVFLSSPNLVYAEKTAEEELKPQIGSIDDSGMVDVNEYEFSNAENKLWLDKHLLNIEQPVRLHYEFVKTGSYEDGFIDDIYLDIIQINEDGTRNAALQFFTEERSQKVSPSNVEKITGNPVIGIYMQGDVYEMSRLTDGGWKYFHRQIKLAIADNNESEPVTIKLNGKEYQGEKITLYPFEKIQQKDRLKEFSNKSYEFIMSEEIPGKLYQIWTVINDPANPSVPLLEEKLTLTNVEFSSEIVANKVN